MRSTAGSVGIPVSSGPGGCQGDALLLEHAIRNLLANASHWARQSGAHPAWVAVSVCSAGGFAELTISDSGPGVAPAGRDQIFGAFFSGRADGMGMGLAICRSVVEAHRGQIEVGVSTPVAVVPASRLNCRFLEIQVHDEPRARHSCGGR